VFAIDPNFGHEPVATPVAEEQIEEQDDED
jgi:hypothetical protein